MIKTKYSQWIQRKQERVKERNTCSTREELNDFEIRMVCQEEQMGHIDYKIDQVFQILRNPTDNVPVPRNAYC